MFLSSGFCPGFSVGFSCVFVLLIFCSEFQIIRFVCCAFTPILFIEISMGCGRSDWPWLFLFCCYQPSCVVSQQSWFRLFCFNTFSNFTPPPQAPSVTSISTNAKRASATTVPILLAVTPANRPSSATSSKIRANVLLLKDGEWNWWRRRASLLFKKYRKNIDSFRRYLFRTEVKLKLWCHTIIQYRFSLIVIVDIFGHLHVVFLISILFRIQIVPNPYLPYTVAGVLLRTAESAYPVLSMPPDSTKPLPQPCSNSIDPLALRGGLGPSGYYFLNHLVIINLFVLALWPHDPESGLHSNLI